MTETQKTITDFAIGTFKSLPHPVQAAIKLNEHVAELLAILYADRAVTLRLPSKLAEISMTMAILASVLKLDLQKAVDDEMTEQRRLHRYKPNGDDKDECS